MFEDGPPFHVKCLHIVPLQYKEYEQVVVEYRIEGEKLRRKQEQESIELLACLKVSSLTLYMCSATVATSCMLRC